MSKDEKVIARFECLLASYAEKRNLLRECTDMRSVEDALLTLVNKGAGQTHPDPVLVVLAGVVGELAISKFLINALLSRAPCSRQKEYDVLMNRVKKRAINYSAAWLTSVSGCTRFAFFWKRQQNLFTHSGAKKMLRRLLGEYFPPKSEGVLA